MNSTPDPQREGEQWTMVVCAECGTPWEVDGGPMCDHHKAETAELAVVPLARLAEVEQDYEDSRATEEVAIVDREQAEVRAEAAEERLEAALHMEQVAIEQRFEQQRKWADEKARAEAAEQRLRDVEEALEKQVQLHTESLRKTAHGRRDRGAFEGQLVASEEALVRVMTIRLKGAG